MMHGWKTWLAAGCMAGLGIVQIASGDVEAGVTQIAAGLALVGLGHKIEKNGIVLEGIEALPGEQIAPVEDEVEVDQ